MNSRRKMKRAGARKETVSPKSSKAITLAEWARTAEKQLQRILKKAQAESPLAKLAPGGGRWQVEVRMLGAAAMAKLNHRYRGKNYSTDVLSFPAPPVFRQSGVLGELLICVPVMKRQAREQGHTSDEELKVLLVHGVLHLLGFDHEKGVRQARLMNSWEACLLGRHAALRGLIQRSS